MAEDCGFRIRVDDRLRKQFIEACRNEDTTAAQTLRAFMRAYVQRVSPADAMPNNSASGRRPGVFTNEI